MYTKQALHDLVITGRLREDWRDSLEENGFFVCAGMFTTAQCQAMATEFDRLHDLEGDRGGHEVHIEPTARRVANIFNKTNAFDPCLEIAPLLLAAHYMLGEFKLHGANLREPLPGGGQQDLHADVPKMFDDDWWVTNAIVAFDDITADNGPPRVVPGSHRWQPMNVAYVNIHDWQPAPLTAEEAARVPADLAAPYPGEVPVTCKAGDVIVINSSLWHAGTANRSGDRRRVLHLTYTRRDLPQQLVQRAHLTPDLYDRMSPAHRFLLDIEPVPAGTAAMTEAAGKAGTGDWWNPETNVGKN